MKTSIVLVMLLGVYVAQAIVVSRKYRKLGPRQNLRGTKAAELTAVSIMDCSRMCLNDKQCKAYKYQGTGPGNCILIHVSCTDTGGQLIEDIDVMYAEGWIPPSGWTGPEAAFYQSFDDSNGLVLWEGTQQVNSVPLVPGQVNCAWTLDRIKSQWIDLGIHTEACMTRPETCGAGGGAFSLWLRVIDCGTWRVGVMSSLADETSGLQISCDGRAIRISIRLLDGHFFVLPPKPTVWTHIVLNYLGPNEGEGITVYYNGAPKRRDPTKDVESRTAGDGRIVVGRHRTDKILYQASINVDELIFFNQALPVDNIETLYQSV